MNATLPIFRSTLATLTLAACCLGQSVAPEFQPAVSEFRNQVAVFDSKIPAQIAPPSAPVVFSAEVPSANCLRGSGLLGTYALDGIMMNIDQLQALGVTAVTINVSFPTLLPDFYGTPEEYASYLNFYIELANRIRSRNLKLIVKSTATMLSGVGSTRYTLADFYRTVTTFQQYTSLRSEVAKVVATYLKPDFLVVMMEPDVEQSQVNQPVNRTENSVEMVRQISAAVESVAPDVKVGAGAGTWSPDYKTLVTELASIPSLDFVDMHIYPISYGFLDRAVEIADLVKARGKDVSVSETWGYKATSLELAGSQLDPAAFYRMVSRRDVFSAMTVPDSEYLRMMVRFAQWKGLAFLSPSLTNQFFAYLNYATYSTATYDVLVWSLQWQAWRNLQTGTRTPTGESFAASLPH